MAESGYNHVLAGLKVIWPDIIQHGSESRSSLNEDLDPVSLTE